MSDWKYDIVPLPDRNFQNLVKSLREKEVDQTNIATSEDHLLNIELICAVDEKLNLIIEHLGLSI